MDGLCCPSESNATAAAILDGRCRYECDEGFTNAGSAAAPDCQADASCSEDLCEGDQLRRCVSGKPQLEDCESGACFAGACCALKSNATASVASEGCTYVCKDGFTNAGTAQDPRCEQSERCAHDVCDHTQLQVCDLATGELGEAEDCPTGACAAGACCPHHDHTRASNVGGSCNYACVDGYHNTGSATAPSCSSDCQQDQCGDGGRLRRCEGGVLQSAESCPTGACAAGACCPHHDHTLASNVGGSCNYACVDGYHNTGSATAPDCAADCEQHECAGDQIRACVDGVLQSARACSAGVCESGACTCPEGYVNDGSAINPECNVGSRCGGAAGRELLTRSGGSSEWTTGSCGLGHLCIQRDHNLPPTCVRKNELIMEFRWSGSTPLIIRSLTDTVGGESFGGSQNSFDVDCNNDRVYERMNVTGQQQVECDANTVVRVRGLMAYVYLGCAGHSLTIEKWGDNPWLSMKGQFGGSACTVSFDDPAGPNLGQAVSLNEAFADNTGNPDVSGWNVENVRYMDRVFLMATSFNQDLSSWDVSNVVSMQSMFSSAYLFNSDISGWDVSEVEDMSGMFDEARAFEQDISGWSVSKVTNMSAMFRNAYRFSGDLSSWDVSGVRNMSSMFLEAHNFNADLSGWDVHNVTAHDNFNTGSGMLDTQLPSFPD